MCSRDAVTTFARPCLFLCVGGGGVHVVALVSCHFCGCSPPSETAACRRLEPRRGPATLNAKPPRPPPPCRCEYVMGLILHSALTICPLSVWLVAGVSSLQQLLLCPARRNASPFVFFPWLRAIGHRGVRATVLNYVTCFLT